MFGKLIDFLRGGRRAATSTVAGERQADTAAGPPPTLDDLELSTSTETENRAERALPGTGEIEIRLHLVPPPLDKDILDVEANKDPNRDFLPDPIAECAVHYPAARRFDPSALSEAMDRKFRESILRPSFYVITAQGRTLYLTSEAPGECVALIAAWRFSNMEDKTASDFAAASRRLGQWLAERPEGFSAAELNPSKAEEQLVIVKRIEAVEPDSVGIVCYVDDAAPMMDGRRVWHVLYAMGFKWGDMDCFQWADPTGQMDYLIWVEFNDEKYGYVLPEEVAAGRQHFRWVNFTLNPSRTPAPEHVLEQLVLAAETFAHQMHCMIAATIDGKTADGPDALRQAVSSVTAAYRALGLKPAMQSILRLR